MEPKGNQDAQYWIEALSKGNDKALAYFFKRYHKSLGYFTLRMIENEGEAEDIVAACFVKLWERRTDFSAPDKLKSFLYVSCRNSCLNYLRHLKVKVRPYRYLLSEVDTYCSISGPVGVGRAVLKILTC